jgi:type II secretory ATPase GspE/PulE/Tfp pilus assembly ATPase PilB-like protein
VLGVGADTLQTLTAGPELQVLDADKEDDLDLANAAQDASIIRFVNQILTEAIESRATDVHIEPFENELRLRYRIDGVLVEANVPASVRRSTRPSCRASRSCRTWTSPRSASRRTAASS